MISLDLPARETPRPKASYQGATINRLTSDWIAQILSADRETRTSLKTLRARSRQLIRDNPHAAGLLRAMEDNVIGPDGIRVNPRMRRPRGSLMDRENLAAWETFRRWGEPLTCTANGLTGWVDTQRLALRTWLADGECFVRRLTGFDNAYGYALQIVDADLLDETYNVPATAGQREITQGIEVDGWGRPVAYHFWNRRSDDGASGLPLRRIAVPASDVIHLYSVLRPNQHRGVPVLTPVLIAMKMLDGYTEAEITAARLASSQGGFFTSTGDDATAGLQTYNPQQQSVALEMPAEPASATQLPPGWTFSPWDPKHPNMNFGAFQTAMLRVISVGVGTSHITLSNDLSDTSYSSGRTGLVAERDHFKRLQRWFGERLVVPVYRDVLRMATLAGMVTLPRAENVDWQACELEFRGWKWIDPKNDAIATEMLLKDKLTSPQRVMAEMGLDAEVVLEEWKEWEGWLAKYGITQPTYGETPTPDTPDDPPGNGPADGRSRPTNGNGHHRLSGADLATLEVRR